MMNILKQNQLDTRNLIFDESGAEEGSKIFFEKKESDYIDGKEIHKPIAIRNGLPDTIAGDEIQPRKSEIPGIKTGEWPDRRGYDNKEIEGDLINREEINNTPPKIDENIDLTNLHIQVGEWIEEIESNGIGMESSKILEVIVEEGIAIDQRARSEPLVL